MEFVNYVHVGEFYKDNNYEVEATCCGGMKTLFIDQDDVMPTDF